MQQESFDLIVIGSGPGGEVGAIRAAQLGMKVALVEKNSHLGGTCLNVGCIPTKCLLESAKTWTKLNHAKDLGFDVGTPSYSWEKIMGRKEQIVDAQRKGLRFLMKKNKIETFEGHGSFIDSKTVQVLSADGGKKLLKTRYVLIATGSAVRPLPGVNIDHKNILSSDSILFMDHVPSSLAVIGGGVVGMEFASLFGRFGTKVTVIEAADQILPFEDPESVKELSRHLNKHQNVTIKTSAKIQSVKAHNKHCTIQLEGAKEMSFDKVLVSIGRVPYTKDLNLSTAGIALDDRGFIPVDAHYKTKLDHVFAIGDVIKTPALAHTASAEAMHAVEVIAGHHPALINYDINPSAIYTYPEIASIGKKEDDLKKIGIAYKAIKFPFAPLAKAKIEDATEGFIKVFVSEPHREILGVHIVGARATELIAEFALGKLLESTIDEIGQTIHPHPTISETVMELAHAAVGGAIHL